MENKNSLNYIVWALKYCLICSCIMPLFTLFILFTILHGAFTPYVIATFAVNGAAILVISLCAFFGIKEVRKIQAAPKPPKPAIARESSPKAEQDDDYTE